MTETTDTSVETNEKIVEFKFNKDAVLPAIKRNSKTVSYTHLTLPTILLV